METTLIYEIIGYVASVLVAVSLMMSKIVQLRIVNMIGAAIFSLYGVLIGSVPVAGMNAFIVLVNIYYLTQIYSSVEYFKLLRVPADSEYLKAFLNFYRDQISQFQPGYEPGFRDDDLNVFVLRDMVPAGLLVGSLDKEGTLSVELDFVTPKYRDFKIGRFLFEENPGFFREKRVKKIVAKSGSEKHNQYLEAMGFIRKSGSDEEYQLQLAG